MPNPKIQTIVREDLAKATKATFPYLYAQLRTKEGKKKIEKKVYDMVSAQGIQPFQAMQSIESDFAN